jgi:hypothetical protein
VEQKVVVSISFSHKNCHSKQCGERIKIQLKSSENRQALKLKNK